MLLFYTTQEVYTKLWIVSWDRRRDAYGQATLTPYYIEALSSNDPDDQEFGRYWLYAATIHQGSIFPPAKAAVPFLVELLNAPRGGEDACKFLATIAIGEIDRLSMPHTFKKGRYFSAVRSHEEAIRDYYQRTHSLSALYLLTFLPIGLPEGLPNCSYENALLLENGKAGAAFLRQAASLLSLTYLTARSLYPSRARKQPPVSTLDPERRDFCSHLVQESPSLLMRICAAVCLAYNLSEDKEAMELLAYIKERQFLWLKWPCWPSAMELLSETAWTFATRFEDQQPL